MEISVGFADKDRGEDESHFRELGYIVDETALGRAYYPAEGVHVSGDIVVRYEKHPWLEAFEVDGISALPARRRGVGTRLIQEYVGSLSDDLYKPALTMYRDNIERHGNFDAAEYWGEVSRLFALKAKEGSTKQFRRYCGFVENMWRDGDADVLRIVEGTILGIITGEDELREIFEETITDEFREYIAKL